MFDWNIFFRNWFVAFGRGRFIPACPIWVSISGIWIPIILLNEGSRKAFKIKIRNSTLLNPCVPRLTFDSLNQSHLKDCQSTNLSAHLSMSGPSFFVFSCSTWTFTTGIDHNVQSFILISYQTYFFHADKKRNRRSTKSVPNSFHDQ